MAEQVSGVKAARENAEAYVDAVLELLGAKVPSDRLTGSNPGFGHFPVQCTRVSC